MIAILLAVLSILLSLVAVGFAVVAIASRSEYVKAWWRSGRVAPPRVLRFKHAGKLCEGRPVRTCGLHILVDMGDGRQLLVSAGEADDRGEFWRTWKYFNGQVEFTDEDGDPWTP